MLTTSPPRLVSARLSQCTTDISAVNQNLHAPSLIAEMKFPLQSMQGKLLQDYVECYLALQFNHQSPVSALYVQMKQAWNWKGIKGSGHSTVSKSRFSPIPCPFPCLLSVSSPVLHKPISFPHLPHTQAHLLPTSIPHQGQSHSHVYFIPSSTHTQAHLIPMFISLQGLWEGSTCLSLAEQGLHSK